MRLAKVFLETMPRWPRSTRWCVTKDGKLLAIDAKINFDDNALFRHPDIEAMDDDSQEKPAGCAGRRPSLNYIALDGNIGCLVNGAGLAMATMDIIKLHGGEPANFLDVGGSVTPEGAIEAFRIILSDPKVKGVLVNIFGGIAKCDMIAEALVAAGREVGFKVPVVVRLEGTNVEQAGRSWRPPSTRLPTLIVADDLDDAAEEGRRRGKEGCLECAVGGSESMHAEAAPQETKHPPVFALLSWAIGIGMLVTLVAGMGVGRVMGWKGQIGLLILVGRSRLHAGHRLRHRLPDLAQGEQAHCARRAVAQWPHSLLRLPAPVLLAAGTAAVRADLPGRILSPGLARLPDFDAMEVQRRGELPIEQSVDHPRDVLDGGDG